MFFKCCNYKKKEKIKVIFEYCNTSPYSRYILDDYYDESVTITELKRVRLKKINNKHVFMINYKKIYFINMNHLKDTETLGSLNTNEILIIYDLE
jgi:hypothetical protein